MMGNIFARHKGDVPTAMKYYDQALKANPGDHIAINNIGANLMQQGRLEEAKKYFRQALEINARYPNTHFALGMIAEAEGELPEGFAHTLQALRLIPKRDALYQNALRQAFRIADELAAGEAGQQLLQAYRRKLEAAGGREVAIREDAGIPTAAKIEFAENYGRGHHLVRYKPGYPAVEHLAMHELVHLELVIEARQSGLNQLFVSTPEHKAGFIQGLAPTVRKLSKMGIPERAIADYCSSLFEGINGQIFNTPIDLFIEQYLYREFPALRPYQFLSLYAMIQEGIKAVTDQKIVELAPKELLSKSKIYNLVNALHFRELFGLDFSRDFQPTPGELKQATTFYDEYRQYQDDREPAEEYELVEHWAEDLKLSQNFALVSEQEYRAQRASAAPPGSPADDAPSGPESLEPAQAGEMEQFQRAQQGQGPNMAVVMYMVDALQFFAGMPREQIRQIATEIALQGTQGFRPDREDYRLRAIPGKTFSGYHILAYYYVSWALAIPEMLAELQLPFEGEYAMAEGMVRR
jgi:tetratricopeptide (TPR) repeat protein